MSDIEDQAAERVAKAERINAEVLKRLGAEKPKAKKGKADG
jgi:hypothetical protein